LEVVPSFGHGTLPDKTSLLIILGWGGGQLNALTGVALATITFAHHHCCRYFVPNEQSQENLTDYWLDYLGESPSRAG